MIRLGLISEPRWLDLGHGVRLHVDPLTTALMVASRSDAAIEALPGTASDEERALVASQVCYRLVDSFATKPTDQLSLQAQAAALSVAVMAVLHPGG